MSNIRLSGKDKPTQNLGKFFFGEHGNPVIMLDFTPQAIQFMQQHVNQKGQLILTIKGDPSGQKKGSSGYSQAPQQQGYSNQMPPNPPMPTGYDNYGQYNPNQ